MSEPEQPRIVALLATQLREALYDPDTLTKAARECGFWRGAVRGLTTNYPDNPAVLVGLMFAARDVYDEYQRDNG